MNEETEYSSWAALAAAYTSAAQKSPDTSTQDHLRFAQFDRFLTRIFAEKEHSEWLLKGGTGMLARVPNTRTTKDLDLVITDRDLDDAQDALVTLAEQDLGDHVTFRVKSANRPVRATTSPR